MKYALLTSTATPPEYKTFGAAAFDLALDEPEHVTKPLMIQPGESRLVHTGVAVEIELDEALLIMVRSSVGSKRMIGLANDVGLIDSDYRGELLITLQNRGFAAQGFHHGERVAQGLIVKLTDRKLRRAPRHELSTTARGTGGHGSTGNT